MDACDSFSDMYTSSEQNMETLASSLLSFLPITESDDDTPSGTLSENDDDVDFYKTLGPTPKMETYKQALKAAAASRDAANEEKAEDEQEDAKAKKKFGMWEGVFMRCLLNIWGVILFLRLGWLVGRAGAIQGTIIVVLAVALTLLTTLSLSAICTNGQVASGGAYFMIAHSLGPEYGGSIGVLFSVANAVAVALYLVGFAEMIVGMGGSMTGSDLMDIRLYAYMTLIILFIVCMIGVGWVVKFQSFLMVILTLSLLGIFFGIALGDSIGTLKPDKGFVGWNSGAFASNMNADYGEESFFSVFAVFFPAATGIMAGANISGDLRNPGTAITRGTILAIFVSSIVYIAFIWLIAAVCEHQQLLDNYLILSSVALHDAFVVAGLVAASLSSALASLVGAPRVFQAVCKDDLVPVISFLGKGRKSDDEPIIAYVVAALLAVACISIGDLNAIAALISQFFLLSYFFINYSCFLADISKSPGWRPTFHYFHYTTAGLGGLMCLGVMFLISWYTALASFAIMGCIYKYIEYNEHKRGEARKNWGSAGQARTFMSVLTSNLRLVQQKEHVKNWRPQLLLLSGELKKDLSTLKLCSYITRRSGLLVVGKVMEGVYKMEDYNAEPREEYLLQNKINGFVDITIAKSLRIGARNLMTLTGIGRFKPNTLVLGFKENWISCPVEEVEEYVEIIRDACRFKFGVMIIRNSTSCKFDDIHAGSIDTYWMDDDGGLTCLLPYLLTKSSRKWRKCKLRLFTRALDIASQDQRSRVQELMNHLRIPVTDVTTLPVDAPVPSDETIMKYARYRVDTETPQPPNRLRDYYTTLGSNVREESRFASAVFQTLPYPQEEVDALVYMSWLEEISKDINAPCVLVRGNQGNVVTGEL